MSANLSSSRLRFVPVTSRRRCSICDHADNCSWMVESGHYKRIYCRRPRFHPAGGKPGHDGGASFPLNDMIAPPRRPAPALAEVQAVERASVDHIDAILTAVLRSKVLSLSDARRQNLLARGLSPAEIAAQGYVDTPTREQGERIARELSVDGLAGVPGFFSRDGETYEMVACRPGFFVPYRDARGRVCGLQYRLDVPLDGGKGKYLWFSSNPDKFPRGTSSLTPLCVSRPHLLRDAREVTLTEGGLKGQIASFYLNAPFIAAAGVTQFKRDFAAWLKAKYPKLQTVFIAFDVDYAGSAGNEDVRRAIFRLMDDLEAARFRVRVRSWDPRHGKGIDNFLLTVANSQREVAA